MKAALKALTFGGGDVDPVEVVAQERQSPALVAAMAKAAELADELARVRAERSRLAVALDATNDHRDEVDSRARALLSGTAVEVVDPDAIRQSMRALRDEETVLVRAQQLHEDTVNRARNAVHGAIRDRLRPRHREIAARIHAAFQELTAALQQEQAFREVLNDRDVPLGDLAAMPFRRGRLDDPQSAASWWLRGARECGAVTE